MGQKIKFFYNVSEGSDAEEDGSDAEEDAEEDSAEVLPLDCFHTK
jgi:hypothetical protein